MMRIGHGYDVHRLVRGRRLILGGVDIPHETGLLGHSDADVLTHAVMDALLGAAALGDIGKLFPDTDPTYAGADSLALLPRAKTFDEAGFNVLLPDLRGHGLSEGDYVGMGWLDRKDVLQWIDWVLAQDSEAEIVLHGVSMGAATTMMTAGEDTPEQVKVFVEDCGYTSVWDIFSSELKLRFGLPEFPILYTASATARAKAGYGFKEASALQQVQNCEKPMLFIHGTADDFIPYEMMGTLYNAKPGTNKATLTAEGAGHGEAMDVLGDTYWNTVFDFEGQYMAG